MSAPVPHAPSFTLLPSSPELATDNVSSIEVHQNTPAKTRLARIVDRRRAAYAALDDSLREMARAPGAPELVKALDACERADRDERFYWENRATALARQVRDLLASRETTPPQRASAVDVLYGRGNASETPTSSTTTSAGCSSGIGRWRGRTRPSSLRSSIA